MTDILIDTLTENIGGLQTFEFIPMIDIASIPDPEDHIILQPVTLKGGKRWFKGYATYQTLEFSEAQNTSKAGEFYKQELKGFVPKDTPDLARLFAEMENHLFIVRYTDNNGQQKIVG